MATETRTTEQQFEHGAKWTLADALDKLRNDLGSAIRDLEDALEVLRNVDAALEAVPCDLNADSIDLPLVAKAVRWANDAWAGPIHVRSIQEDINRAAGNLSEAVGQVDYLEAGDFSE